MSQPSDDAVFILTLGFDAGGFQRFDGMRRAHFPAKRNLIPAHLTLFHKLPGERLEAFASDLEEVTRDTPPFEARITGLRFLGYGSAYVVEAPRLIELRAELARRWIAELGAQDTQRFTPHVTIQNKVAAPVARAMFERLNDEFEPFTATAQSLLLWRYLNGPWAQERRYDFRAAE